MDSIITYLFLYNQYLLKVIYQLLLFISKYIPLKQWAFDDSHSPEYQKYKVDKLPVIITRAKQDYKFLQEYYKYKYGSEVKPVRHSKKSNVPPETVCPCCGATHDYLYDNNGGRGQFLCKICGRTFNNVCGSSKELLLKCPYCSRVLDHKKDRKYFRIHKCINPKCSYYLNNFKKLPPDLKSSDKFKYKLHYIYREFTVDFFKMDLSGLSKRVMNFNFKKFNPQVMGLCLTYNVNLQLSTRKTALALKEVHNIDISHTQVANYAMTAATIIKPLVDNYDYKPSKILAADETYIKVKGVKHYVWIIMDACKKSILGYQVSQDRSVGPCILAMRMAFNKFKEFPGKALRFVADGYTAYPLASQQFAIKEGKDVSITQVIGLTNDDAVSKEFRWIKQVIERLNRTFKSTYRVYGGYGSEDGAVNGVSLWVAYYNFLRPHPYNYWKPLNEIELLDGADNMPGKWQLLILLGQQAILKMQSEQALQ